MTFDYSILKEFIPKEDISSFLVWDSVYTMSSDNNIICLYRLYSETKRMKISISDYKNKLRDSKLNIILDESL